MMGVDVLRNPAYIGCVWSEGKMIRATHEGIIERDVFDRVQKKLTDKGRPHPTAKKEFLYKGLIRCSECGRNLVGEIQKGHRYYHCTSAKCRGTWYREDKIAVWQEFADAFRIMQAETEALDLLRKALKEVTKTGTGGVEDEIRDLRQSYNKIEAKLLQIYDDRLSGIFNTEICRKKMTELEQQQQSIKTKIELLERDAHKVLKGGLDILDLGEQVARKVEGFNLEQKRRLLMIMMEDAEAKDGKVSYKITFPISLMFELSKGKHPQAPYFSAILDSLRRVPVRPMLAGLRGLL